MEFHHISILLPECIKGLNIQTQGTYVDGTLGGAGHAKAICNAMQTGRFIGLDKDPDACSVARERLQDISFATVIQADFSDLKAVLASQSIATVQGILLDIGVSSHQLDSTERGFSFHRDAALDMRMSQAGLSAYDVVNTYTVQQLRYIFKAYGEESFAGPIAKAIVAARSTAAIRTTLELVEVVKSALPAAIKRKEKHPAKKVFQSIRIEVNQELERLKEGIEDGFSSLSSGGRLAIITFHSLEDRIVKRKFLEFATGCDCPPDFPICVCHKQPRGKLITKKPILPSVSEQAENSRSRSAKLRIIEKV